MKEITFKVEATRPEEAAEHQALLLAEALADAQLFEAQMNEYLDAAKREMQKADDLNEVLAKVKAGTYKSQRRMDPYATYDPAAILAEIRQARERQVEFNETAMENMKLLNDARRRSEEAQKKLKIIRDQKRRS